MTVPVEVQFKDPKIQEDQHKIGTKTLQFTVVNNPQPTQIFEDLPKLDLGTEPPPAAGAGPTVNGNTEQINIPGFKVIYQTLKNQNHTLPLNNYHIDMIVYDELNIDRSKASKAVIRNLDNNLRVAYMNRFTISVNGITKAKYIWTDGTVLEEICDNIVDQTPLLYDNIPLTTVLSRDGTPVDDMPEIIFGTDNDTVIILYMPIDMKNRFNLEQNKANGNLHRFEYYFINPSETINSKVFATALDSLVHVVKGTATIGEYTLEKQNFYSHSGARPVEITAGIDGAVVVISTRVEDYID